MHQGFSIGDISWKEFLLACLFLALAYWFVILLLYYRKELRGIINGKGVKVIPESVKSAQVLFSGVEEPKDEPLVHQISEKYSADESDKNRILFPLSYELVDELKTIISSAAEKKIIKEELFYALQLPLRKEIYADLKVSPFHYAINNFIEAECAAHCEIQFSPEELNMLWNR